MIRCHRPKHFDQRRGMRDIKQIIADNEALGAPPIAPKPKPEKG